MAALKLLDFHQKRLMLFVVDKKDGWPLRKIPLYGEASINDPTVTTDHADILGQSGSLDEIKRRVHPALLEIILAIIEVEIVFDWIRRNGGQNRFDNLMSAVGSQLANMELLSPEIEAPAGIRATLGTAIAEIARNMDIPKPSISFKQTMSLGLLASDHVGFASFDLERLAMPQRPEESSASEAAL